MSIAALQIDHLVKRYPNVCALDDVSLRIEPGEFFGLLGPNGAGKTTVISIVAGLTRATSGRAQVMGHDVHNDYRSARRALGVVPQELAFDPFFTVRETLRLQSGYFGLHRNDDWIDEVMAHLDLTGKADTNMRALSGGMKRRVLVAQALVHRPDVIVLDEPTAGVDVELRHALWAFIRRLNAKGHTIVLTTHYLEEAQALCHRIGMLHQGKLVALDTTRALLRRVSDVRVRLRVRGQLPESVQAKVVEGMDGDYVLRLGHAAEIEPMLAACRAAAVAIDEVDVGHADLEDVFIQLMDEYRAREAA